MENVGRANPFGGRFCLVELLAVLSLCWKPEAVIKDTFWFMRAVFEASVAAL